MIDSTNRDTRADLLKLKDSDIAMTVVVEGRSNLEVLLITSILYVYREDSERREYRWKAHNIEGPLEGGSAAGNPKTGVEPTGERYLYHKTSIIAGRDPLDQLLCYSI